ncbi:MAG: D,D-heptose 1,7-bisphosphate phosphatase [Ignavibacteriales bacterium CG_4_9_14_3_um_filter_34_10]|nr:MAG: D,D-heptose 1,7-bisphosphate phosphatase [Ignavibacteriales bacterium CG_4_9_14_3_um_filter_34_10]
MKNIAVFLDRDNTLNFDPGYLNDPESVKLLPGVGEGLTKLKSVLNCKFIVISNQSGVARGFYTEETIIKINNRINELLFGSGFAQIDDFFYCIHHPEFSDEEKSKCRKPSPQMVFDAAKKYLINLADSYFAGDAVSDVECGKNAGTKTVLLVYDEGDSKRMELAVKQLTPDFIAKDFSECCNFIIEDFKGKNN